jgi:hypothetical protein
MDKAAGPLSFPGAGGMLACAMTLLAVVIEEPASHWVVVAFAVIGWVALASTAALPAVAFLAPSRRRLFRCLAAVAGVSWSVVLWAAVEFSRV